VVQGHRQGGIHLEYSNRIELLVESLAGALGRDRRLRDLFDPPRVVVPNRNVEKFLKFELADRFGVVGDIAISTLEAWLREALPEGVEPLDEDRLATALLGLLWSDRLPWSEPVLEPVRSYLEGDGDGGRALRAHQLARRVAKNFREYAHSRVEMLDAWRSGDELYTSAPQYRRNERWQRLLWRRLFGSESRLQKEGPEEGFSLLTEYWRRFEPGDVEQLPDRVHLFALSHVAPVYGPVIERLARAVELRFFVLNPCREFWEDVVYDEQEEIVEAAERGAGRPVADVHLPVGDRREGLPKGGDPEPMELDPEGPSRAPLALNVWGRAGRDHVHMLNRLAGYSFIDRWVDPAAGEDEREPTLLEVFQSDVLRYVRAADSDREPQADGSIRFVEAPGVRRELEAVADAIWRLVVEHDDVDFNDIAVVVNPRRREEYQMHLEAVFEEVRGIPFNQIDVRRGDGSRLLEAAELLMELPLGDFDRRELGGLLTHPNVVAVYDEAEAEEWERWCEELAIFHGADARDHEGTHIDRDLYNWDQGVKRLVLGAFLEERPRGAVRAEPFEIGGEAYVPESPGEGGDPGAAGRWIELVRRLTGEARAVQSREDTLGGWLRWIADWMEEHLAAARSGEEAELNGYLRALRSAAQEDLSERAGGGSVPYRTAVEYARERLASRTYERGHYLATGVVVSSFLPQRPIPFEAIFMTGLSAEDFPASSPRTPVDLRTAAWHQGDLWDRDRERYMFFETLLSARRRVTCSWVARDAVTGDAIEPSSVVREFQHILEDYVGDDLERLVCEHPLRRFDGRYFDPQSGEFLGPTFHPSARLEARARRLRRAFLEATGAERTTELDVDRAAQMLEGGGEGLEETFPTVEPPATDAEPDAGAGTRALPLRALRSFLASPLQGWARYRLGLRSDDSGAGLQETDEPFELEPLEESRILREAFERSVHESEGVDADLLAESLRATFDFAMLEGRAPAGAFSRIAEQRVSSVADSWAEQLRENHPSEPLRFRFGAPAGYESIRERRAVTVEIERGSRVRRLELVGDTSLVDAAGETLFIPTRTERSRVGWRHALRGWVQGLVLSAAEVFEGESFVVELLTREADSARSVPFSESEPERAREQLEAIAADLWFDAHEYRFAISELEEVIDGAPTVDPTELRRAVWDADDGSYGASRDAYGPVSGVGRYGIPEGDSRELTDRLLRRMGPFVRGAIRAEL